MNVNFDDQVFVIGFVGDTGNDKSFLVNDLGVNSFITQDDEHEVSTTANVTSFESISMLHTK